MTNYHRAPWPSPKTERIRRVAARLDGEDGRVTAFVLVMVTALLLVAGLVLDGGTALAGKSRAIGIAEEAARAGCQQLDLARFRADGVLVLDPVAADAAARRYLDAAGAAGVVAVTQDQIRVTATVTTRPQILTAIGIGPFRVTGNGAARPTPTTAIALGAGPLDPGDPP